MSAYDPVEFLLGASCGHMKDVDGCVKCGNRLYALTHYRALTAEKEKMADVLREKLRGLGDSAYLQYSDHCKRVECLGADAKIASGKFGREELTAHMIAQEWLGKHKAYREAARIVLAALTPPVEAAPKPNILCPSCGGPATLSCGKCGMEFADEGPKPAPKPEQFDALRAVNVKRNLESFKHDDWTMGDWGNAFGGEAGEAQNKIKKLRAGKPMTPEEIADEVADTVIYGDLICWKLGVSLWEAIVRKFDEVSVRVGSPHRLGSQPAPGGTRP